jgi:Ca2+/H+ antiporter
MSVLIIAGCTDKQPGTLTVSLLIVIVIALYLLMFGLCLAAGRSRKAEEACDLINNNRADLSEQMLLQLAEAVKQPDVMPVNNVPVNNGSTASRASTALKLVR